MQGIIRRLDPITIYKIAAGEVIENPASIVKELIENSLDAEATEITIAIEGGGRDLIRLSDDGFGMSEADAILCIERYATSKISFVEDIFCINTMGFRGEALASIASVSKLTILTAPRGGSGPKEEEGTLLLCEGGKIASCSRAIRDPGTTIEVKSLFFNLPVRKKFLRSPAYDAQEVLKIVSVLALANPAVHFRLVSNGKTILNTPVHLGGGGLKGRVGAVLGQDFVDNAVYIENKRLGYLLEGFYSKPSFTRPNRTGQYLFINRRAITSFFVAQAIRNGYGSAIAEGRHPLWTAYLTIPEGLVDVNVHPQKKEVRIRQEETLRELIVESIRGILLQNSSGHVFFPSAEKKEERREPYSCSSSRAYEEKKYSAFDNVLMRQIEREAADMAPGNIFEEVRLLTKEAANNSKAQEFFEDNELKESLPETLFEKSVQILAITLSYIILDGASLSDHPKAANFLLSEKGIVIIEIKAAKARLLFEELSTLLFAWKSEKSSNASQLLLLPVTVKINAIEKNALLDQSPALQSYGINLKISDDSCTLEELPQPLMALDSEAFLLELVHQLQEEGGIEFFEEKLKKVLAAAALQTAKSFNLLTIEEGQALVSSLLSCGLPHRSPGGKATMIHLTEQELLSRFNK